LTIYHQSLFSPCVVFLPTSFPVPSLKYQVFDKNWAMWPFQSNSSWCCINFDLKKHRYENRNGGNLLFFWYGRCVSYLFTYWNEIYHSTNFWAMNNLICLCVMLYLCIDMCCHSWVSMMWVMAFNLLMPMVCTGLFFHLLFITPAVCHFSVGVVLHSSLWSIFLNAFVVDLFIVFLLSDIP